MKKNQNKPIVVSAKVSEAVKKKLEAKAKKEDRKISYIVNQILETALS